MNRRGPEPDPPRSYVIDVCLTCGKHAVYPFCAHRSETARWTYPLVVAATATARRGLIEGMRDIALYADIEVSQ